MSTIRLYQSNRYLSSNTSVVTGVMEKNGCDVIICEASVFYPEGGGQPSDTGEVILNGRSFRVMSAHDSGLESDVRHYTDAPAGTFSTGDTVDLHIDWDLRFSNMQRHLGEHMLSGTMNTLFNGVNKGFHMGEEYITIDIDLGGHMLTQDELDLAEKTVNEAIWADLPVDVTWFDDYEASRVMPVRKAVPHDGRVSVVTVGDRNDPYDCIACCGTHPETSSEVGLLAIYKCEPNKGMNRIFFDCGRMAKNRLSSDSRLLSEIARRYSCSTKDLLARLDKESSAMSELKARLSLLSQYVRDSEEERIMSELSDTKGAVYTYSSDILSTDELLKLGFNVSAKTGDMLLLFMNPANFTCLLFSSGDIKCGKLVREYAPAFNGKGGGRDDNARAMFRSAADLDGFARKIQNVI